MILLSPSSPPVCAIVLYWQMGSSSAWCLKQMKFIAVAEKMWGFAKPFVCLTGSCFVFLSAFQRNLIPCLTWEIQNQLCNLILSWCFLNICEVCLLNFCCLKERTVGLMKHCFLVLCLVADLTWNLQDTLPAVTVLMWACSHQGFLARCGLAAQPGVPCAHFQDVCPVL